MTDAIDAHVEWIGKLQHLRVTLAHIPYAARHQESIARPLAEEMESAYLADALPESIAALWDQYRASVNQALTRAVEQADVWDAEFPVLATRPVGEGS